MAISARPRRYLTGLTEDLEGVYEGEMKMVSAALGTLVFECEVVHPPSMKGRTIYVWFQDQDITDALKSFRDEAIRVRSKPMEEPSEEFST